MFWEYLGAYLAIGLVFYILIKSSEDSFLFDSVLKIFKKNKKQAVLEFIVSVFLWLPIMVIFLIFALFMMVVDVFAFILKIITSF